MLNIDRDKLKISIESALGIADFSLLMISETQNDIDLAIIVPDHISRDFVIESISSIFMNKTIEIGKFITFTPINITAYSEEATAFIRNIKSKSEVII